MFCFSVTIKYCARLDYDITNRYITERLFLTKNDMKKTANKKGGKSPLKRILEEDGRKLKWLSVSTGINYQRLQRITNHGYEPTISEAARITNCLKRPLHELFPSLELTDAMTFNGEARAVKGQALERKKR